MTHFVYLHIKIFSFLDQHEWEIFYQPYQIWYVKRVRDGLESFPVTTDPEQLEKTVSTYKSLIMYSFTTRLEIIEKPMRFCLKHSYLLKTDEQRIFATKYYSLSDRTNNLWFRAKNNWTSWKNK